MPSSVIATTYPSARNDASESKLENWLDAIVSDGVIWNEGNGLAVFADSTGMQVKAPSGSVMLAGIRGDLASQTTLDIAAANSTNPRIDTVVAELKRTPSPYTISFKVVTGTAATSPVSPTLTNDATYRTIPLVDVRVDAGATTIAAGKITDRRVFAQAGQVDPSTGELVVERDLLVGDFAMGRPGTAVAIGGFGASEAYIKARGSSANVPLILMSKGSGTGTNSAIMFVASNGDTSAYFTVPAGISPLDTTLILGRQLGSTFTLQRVTQGAADSGGSGLRALTVPN